MQDFTEMDFKLFKEMLRRLLFITFTAATLACGAAPAVQQMVDGVENITPDEQQGLVAKELVGLIENYNYKRIKINDSISSLVLDRYIKSLDPSRYYFLESDVKEFEQYRYLLDDHFRNGDLASTFYVFNVYLKRYNERLDYSIAQIKNQYAYNQDDTFVYDREKLPWLTTTTALDDYWKKRVKYELLNLKLAGTDQSKNVETLTKRYQNLKSQSAKLNNQDVFQLIMNAFTESIDPHTNYFNPRNAETFNQEMARSLEGIGASLQLDNEVTKVISIIPGGPAFKSKLLHAGDRIVAVAQGEKGEFEDVVGWRIDNTVSKIKGPKGTVVRLKVIPAGQELSSQPVTIQLVRDKVILADQSAQKSVKVIESEGKPYKIGVINVPAFYADFKAANAGDPNYKSTTRDVKLLIDTLQRVDKVDAIIMDLRGNGGGSLLEAIDLTGLFIDKGPVVQVKDLNGSVEVNEDKKAGVLWSGPLGVMVDRLSASASEIFAGAIQDYGRGIIMGSQTFGKGTVQSAIDMNRVVSGNMLQRLAAKVANAGGKAEMPKLGQINLTIAKFYRINGSSTQHKGVLPDVVFPSLYPLDKIGEDTEPSALPFDMVKPSTYQTLANLTEVRKQLVQLHDERMKKSVDYKVLVADIEEGKKRDLETSITLNETKLKTEREALAARSLARTNELRSAKGMPLLKKGEKATKEEIFDFIQDESMRIIVDYIKLQQRGQLTGNL